MILERQFPFDERVEKEAQSLIAKGHKVFILSFNYDGLAEVEDYKGISVHRFRISRKVYNKLSPLHRVFPLYYLIWKKVACRFFKDHDIDVIHVHDLPLANLGVWLKRKFGCKLILDQHELWSETVKHYRHYNTFVGTIVRKLSCWGIYEKRQFKQADKIITVEEPIKTWYVDNTNTSEKKIIVVPNTPLKEQIEKISFKEREDKAGFILYYAGKIDHNRYIDSVIKALPKLLEKIPEIKFNIAGNIAKACDPRIWAKQYGVEKQVRYLGQLSYEDMMQKMKDADICISLLPSYSEELNRTIVTKIYQYIQLQKPMIVSRTDYIQEFVRKHKIGSVVNEEDPQTIYKEVLALYKNKETMNLYAQNCAKIKESLIWEKTVQALLNLYRDMDKV